MQKGYCIQQEHSRRIGTLHQWIKRPLDSQACKVTVSYVGIRRFKSARFTYQIGYMVLTVYLTISRISLYIYIVQ